MRTLMGIPALEIREVTYTVNGRKILDAVSWKVERGEHWAILGPNGAGKTTLLKIVCGYLWPNGGGEVRRQGEKLVDLRELRRSIGWVTSALNYSIPKDEAVLSTVLSGRYAQVGFSVLKWEAPSKKDYRLAQQHLDELGCSELAQMPFGSLSQGEQQKVLIARARMSKPYLIILDEPCAGLDPGAREKFLASLQTLGLQKEAPSLVYVTHHLEEILPVFKKTLIFKEGRVIASGSTEQVIQDRALEDLYGISMKIIRRNGRYWPICA
jgi:iron complex transport system ATP-binding protein